VKGRWMVVVGIEGKKVWMDVCDEVRGNAAKRERESRKVGKVGVGETLKQRARGKKDTSVLVVETGKRTMRTGASFMEMACGGREVSECLEGAIQRETHLLLSHSRDDGDEELNTRALSAHCPSGAPSRRREVRGHESKEDRLTSTPSSKPAWMSSPTSPSGSLTSSLAVPSMVIISRNPSSTAPNLISSISHAEGKGEGTDC
jgi:hypothetical protein